MNAIDTNIYLYAIDDAEPVKQRKAIDLLDRLEPRRSPVVLPWQVAVEYLNGLRRWARSGKVAAGRVESQLEELLAIFPLAFPTRDVFGISLSLSSKYSLSHWDSMLLAACIDARVTTLYSEDLSDGMTYESVTVINPLK